MTDQLQKFLFQQAAVRGEFVEIGKAWSQIQSNHHYPSSVTRLLGEMIGAAALLCGNIKFNGALILQIQGDGPVRLLVVECDSALHIRATAKLDSEAVISDEASFTDLINAHGRGRFVITLDPHDKVPGQQPYQGIVSLEGDTISHVIENYMKQSEQLDTRIQLAADKDVIRGLLLQKMPSQTGADGLSEKNEEEENAWQHLAALASTLKPKEMLETDVDTLRHRLFWDEDVYMFDPLTPVFQCTCSRDKVAHMLKMLGEKEVNDALAEQGDLSIDCDFCGQSYPFNKDDCARIFSPEPNDSTGNTIH
ncbi:Hsp33 family molecular chaperone HslO [Oxalobacter formigenes]|uniref:Chaperonin HslO n=1 Tax=Oxalobacter formigenes OXCC13 TaxID=556269 RepID=C3XAC2_OXAFO|nr:Hsp33 family molecular chaperone HslO [Oxalobacter formigenes]ARQ45708.1 33 kDa chaperonin [Oxalobacter formigenes]ARQ77948.1 Hsp33 family molecular chaperone [Oxalobacter formigenes OXCC13]EEO30148.1 chaperonin HslO [Oxalobacter formigenes OXCC13]MCZ4063108.1 Hsp33 family molecular chaperone HslO [Oxalobacter formigenes]QDX33503.1 Hsp33 family molecular chaperone HslO [Oxalobacter formigenes]